ncbi:AsmA family protein [Flavobacterium capsici]|uniref:AsmA-like C-terminal region-containing protein n=1 Tax=Flavobacterium capsici TaxID=3075618 RepID=A0AA96J2Y2_9FLAO|nr:MULTISPECIES: AsmA-like C-terminal region-containing protein [unclassified Flavobacterium]WNM19962.1 AsmA-like C-terminal region-containing protein [Flavobacterium sp. PMR2A8]WNM21351.1 AsmA-like C-terminal region-containing protein [Flavobacterium sp. PMTSA4]
MEKKKKHIIFRILKATGISFAILLLLMFLLPILFPGKIAEEVKTFANNKLEGELDFKEAKLSFFEHFPSLTLTLTDFSLKGSAPYKNETLLSAKDVSFGINLKSLIFDSKITIDKIFVFDANVNVLVNEKGEANYNVYKSETTTTETDSSTTSLRLDKIAIKNTHLIYNDKSAKILIDAKGFNYVGKGDLNEAIFDLYTEAKIDSFDFTYDGEQYLKNKKVNADLITQINTNSLAFVFQQNNLKINQLPVEFKGKFNFLSNGYDMDFEIKSEDSYLEDFFTALPPQYVTWLDKTKVKGKTDLALTLKGKYIVAQNLKPNLAFNMKIRDGFINNNKAPIPVSNIFLNFDTKLPQLDAEKLQVNVDSIFFNLNKDYVKAIIKSEGLSKPLIDARIESKVDLAQLDRAFGLGNMDLKGNLNATIRSKGIYDKKQNKIPVTKGTFNLKNGYIKTDYYPNPITNINVTANILDQKGNLDDLKIDITPASFEFEGKPIYVHAKLQNFNNIAYDIKAKGELNIGKIYKVFSQKGLDLEGIVNADVTFKGTQNDAVSGNYSKLQNSGTLSLQNINTTTEYLPKPFIIREGLFKFNQDKMNFDNFKATYGESDFVMNGALQNVIEFVLTDKAILKGQFNFNSNYINVDEFMSKQEVEKSTVDSTTTATGVIIIPSNFDLQLKAKASKINFDGLAINNLNGGLNINKGRLELKNASVEIIDCKVKMDAVYGNQTDEKAFFDMKVNAKDFDVKRAYNEIKLFHEIVTAAESAEGIVSLDYKLAGILDGNMMPIFPSLRGNGVLSVSKVKMKGFKLMNVVSRKTGKEGIANPDLSKVDIKTSIKNNIITIERFKFKVAGFRPRIEGTTSFDGQLNIKMRLGLPPLGIIGIPIKVTGTQDNPKVKLGKQTEDLQETEYEGEVPEVLKEETN